ncbi:MAG: hypothetical protein ACOCP8_06080 [archaeon]
MKDKQLENLKNMVEQKIQLENEEKIHTNEYVKNKSQIRRFITNLSENDAKYLKKLCKQEYENYLNFFNSDINHAQKTVMDRKMDIIMKCLDLISKRLIKKSSSMELQF